MAKATAKVDPPEQTLGQYWHAQLEQAQKTLDKWQTRGKKVVKRYRDERDAIEGQKKKFNILWSNIQVMSPSLYGRDAKPEVSRRNMDQDVIGRVSSTMLERCLMYEVEQFPDFDAAMRGVVEDRLLPGLGTAWVRFAPNMVTEEVEEGQITDKAKSAPSEKVDSAHSPCDYVYWQDFLFSPARTWEEVWWVSRWVYMTKEEGIERFGEVFNNVPLESEEPVKDWQNNAEKKASVDKKAKVAEIWDKRKGSVCWVAKGYAQHLDEKEDPLTLEGYFPCPKPLFATTTNGSLIPVPDYCEYEDQAVELDSITNRISMLVKACKAVGVFNAEYKELSRLLNEGVDNKLFPVTAWAALAEKGGLQGAVDMLDLSTVITALKQLYESREQVKQTIYETMGLGDIVRGATDPNETLGAQQLKANFGSLRLRNSQADVARFASDLFRLKAQIICKFYPAEVIVEMSGIKDTEDGKDPAVVEQAVQMLKDSTVRDFHICVESDSLAQIDDQAEKQSASEAIQAIGIFLKEAIPMVAGAPETLPMVSEMLLFLVRRYRAGRSLEAAIEKAMKALEMKAQQAAQNPPQNPEMMKVHAQQQIEQMKMQATQQAEQARMQADAMIAQQQAQVEEARAQREAVLEQQKAEREAQLKREELATTDAFNRWKVKMENDTKIIVAQISAQSAMDTTLAAAEHKADVEFSGEMDPQPKVEKPKPKKPLDVLLGAHKESAEQTKAMMTELIGVMQRPRKIIRGPDGRVSGVE